MFYLSQTFVIDQKLLSVGANRQRVIRYDIDFYRNRDVSNTYTIITLNYDRLIESVFDYISEHESLQVSDENLFFRNNEGLKLYKLHGSVDKEIIPPTWNKILNEHVQDEWGGAFPALKNAKHIRILGYSLPNSDSIYNICLRQP